MTAAEWWRRARAQWTADPPARRWQDVDAYLGLSRHGQHRAERAIKAAIRDRDADIGAVGFRAAGDVAVAEMNRPHPALRETVRPLSRHAALEVATVAWTGRPLPPGAPVPGCSCADCTGIPADHPARRRPARKRQGAPLDLDAARAVPVSAVARALGLELDPSGKRARCPFHDDRRPSMDLRDNKGRAFCSPCARSWDSIALVRELRGCTFADAVRYLLEVSR